MALAGALWLQAGRLTEGMPYPIGFPLFVGAGLCLVLGVLTLGRASPPIVIVQALGELPV